MYLVVEKQIIMLYIVVRRQINNCISMTDCWAKEKKIAYNCYCRYLSVESEEIIVYIPTYGLEKMFIQF